MIKRGSKIVLVAKFGQRGDHSLELGKAAGLLDERTATSRERRFDIGRIVRVAHRDQSQGRRIELPVKPTGKIDAVQLRHPNVGQDDDRSEFRSIVRKGEHFSQRVRAILRRDYPAVRSHALRRDAEEAELISIVVHDHESRFNLGEAMRHDA